MKYSNFTTEQIMENTNYLEICKIFLELTNDSEQKNTLKDILYLGGHKKYSISSKIVSKDNPLIEIQRRLSMAYLLLRNPQTFDVLSQNKVNLFHGTNANSLYSILKYGLNSTQESQNLGISVTTGEKWSRMNGTREFVSFTDVLEIAEDYSTLKPTDINSDLSFSIIIGTTVEDVTKIERYRIASDIPEVGVKNNLPTENIRTICVPSDKVEFVKKIVNNKEIEVLAIDDIEEKFYYMDDLGSIYIDDYLLNEVKNNLTKTNTNKTFEIEEIEEVTLTRLLTNIKNQFKKFISTMNIGMEIEYDRRKVK